MGDMFRKSFVFLRPADEEGLCMSERRRRHGRSRDEEEMYLGVECSFDGSLIVE